jgi:hypothetical protein
MEDVQDFFAHLAKSAEGIHPGIFSTWWDNFIDNPGSQKFQKGTKSWETEESLLYFYLWCSTGTCIGTSSSR